MIIKLHDQIYQGDKDSVLKEEFKNYNITYILNLDHNNHYNNVSFDNVIIKRIPIPDEDTPTNEQLLNIIDFCLPVLKNGNRLLIHCLAGKNRSCIISSLIKSFYLHQPFKKITEELHEFYLKNYNHNWWPYEHWNIAINTFLDGE